MTDHHETRRSNNAANYSIASVPSPHRRIATGRTIDVLENESRIIYIYRGHFSPERIRRFIATRLLPFLLFRLRDIRNRSPTIKIIAFEANVGLKLPAGTNR